MINCYINKYCKRYTAFAGMDSFKTTTKMIAGSHQISRLMNPDRNFPKHSDSPPNQGPSPAGSPIPPIPPIESGRSNAVHFFNQGKVAFT